MEILFVLIIVLCYSDDLFYINIQAKGFQENIFVSNSNTINCARNMTIIIFELSIQQNSTLCSVHMCINVTKEKNTLNVTKRNCHEENTWDMSMIIPNTSSCVYNAFQNVSISYSCAGLNNYSQACRKTDESILDPECSKFYEEHNTIRIMFDRKFVNCSAVNNESQTSNVNLCIDFDKLDIGTFNHSEMVRKNLNCFQRNWLIIEFKCEEKDLNVLSEVAQKKKVSIDIGSIVGMIVDIVLLVCVVSISCLISRSGMCRKSTENQKTVTDNSDHISKPGTTLPSISDGKNKQTSHCNDTKNNYDTNIYNSAKEEV